MRRLNLGEWSVESLRTLQAEVSAELALRHTPRSRDRDDLLRVWHAATVEVLQRQLGLQQSFHQWKRAAGRTASPHVAAAEKLAGRFFQEVPRAIAVHPARVVVVEALVSWLQARTIPVTFGTVATNLQSAGTAVDAAFPGYLKSGLLHLTLARRDFEGQ